MRPLPRIISIVSHAACCREWRPQQSGSLLVSTGTYITLLQGLCSKSEHLSVNASKCNRLTFSHRLLRNACGISWHPLGEYVSELHSLLPLSSLYVLAQPSLASFACCIWHHVHR